LAYKIEKKNIIFIVSYLTKYNVFIIITLNYKISIAGFIYFFKYLWLLRQSIDRFKL